MCQYLYQRGMRLTLKGFVERVISENFGGLPRLLWLFNLSISCWIFSQPRNLVTKELVCYNMFVYRWGHCFST